RCSLSGHRRTKGIRRSPSFDVAGGGKIGQTTGRFGGTCGGRRLKSGYRLMATDAPAITTTPGLDFEQPLVELDSRRRELEQTTSRTTAQDEQLRQVRRDLAERTREIYSNLTPWQTVQVARHKDRPYTSDYLSLAFEEFIELHGDRRFGDDRAIRTCFARLERQKVLVVGHQKGRTYKERSACYFGCAHPEGYRKAILKMKLAEKYGLPVICLIDTPGAYPGIGA